MRSKITITTIVLLVFLFCENVARSDEPWFPNPNETRLLFAPTARSLKKGEGYFADHYIIFPTIVYGVTDRFTIGGGMSVIPGANLGDQALLLTPKFGFPISDRFDMAIGGLFIKVPSWDEGSVGILYSVGTIGNENSNLTFGIGYGYVDTDLADKPFIVFGGEHRFTKRVAFVSENWFVPAEIDQLFYSFGIRLMDESLSVDFALINMMPDPIGIGIPYLDFVWKF